jgi:hypothetical protein
VMRGGSGPPWAASACERMNAAASGSARSRSTAEGRTAAAVEEEGGLEEAVLDCTRSMEAARPDAANAVDPSAAAAKAWAAKAGRENTW